MIIDQADVARLSDDDVRRLVLTLEDGAGGRPGGVPAFWRHLARTLRRTLLDRQRLLAVMELGLLNDEEAEGSLVGPGDDPVADALEELRRGLPEWPVS